MEDFIWEILSLIELKQEGSYWDFKSEWQDKKGDLLHDIICMANNLDNRDAYIIIGVDDNSYELIDVSNDPNRRNTQQLVDFLKDKKFAGEIRPTVFVKELNIYDKTIDVIVVKNSFKTPYYLKERYGEIRQSNIYTRIQDTNTPTDRTADIDKVEYLWKKRFGLIQTPIEKLEIYLKDPKNWVNGPNGEMDKYYKFFPEYTFRYDFKDESHYDYYLFFQTDPTPRNYVMRFYYHTTLLAEFTGVGLDGGRYTSPLPFTTGIKWGCQQKWNIKYEYFEKDSFEYTFNEFLYLNERTDGARIARQKFIDSILIFENAEERLYFEYYVENHWVIDEKKYEKEINMPNIPHLGENYRKDAFQQECRNMLILQKMLDDYRKLNR